MSPSIGCNRRRRSQNVGGVAFGDRLNEGEREADIAIFAEFIEGARTSYSLTRAPTAIGFANGSIMAVILLLTHSGHSGGFRSYHSHPFRDDVTSRLNGKQVVVIYGEKDDRRSAGLLH